MLSLFRVDRAGYKSDLKNKTKQFRVRHAAVAADTLKKSFRKSKAQYSNQIFKLLLVKTHTQSALHGGTCIRQR